ncbi:MAG: thioredoxin fold domain-containing protein [Candidatus Eisenbacteria bacterium]|uniref:Thioredoxin fold domain-containing protein n=1 Tax=Eiseniibacteriota bacterium TaxID=2212470 RepID=A0A849SEY1_UNCEI|nr:thioredoxin fold domain-containing protein [Candidatus Eisenbacteria bacterium]
MIRKLAAALFALVLGAAPARAQFGDIPPAETLVQSSAAPLSVAAGARATVELRLTITPSWHVNANPPASPELIQTEVRLTGAGGITPGKITYPAGHTQKLSFSDEPLLVYDGTVTVRIPVTVAAAASVGEHTLKGVVSFQACNDHVCLPPTDVPFEARITVTAATPGAAIVPAGDTLAAMSQVPPPEERAIGERMTAPPAPGTDPATPRTAAGDAGALQRRITDAVAKGGIGWFLLLFTGGLLLNLTPCVFPMIGVTVSVFGARRKESSLRVFSNALAYVLGIAVMYSVLGVVAALTGGLFGAALQNPMVNVGLGLLFMVLALSMFGLYEMTPPLWLMQKVGGAGTTSVLGLFMSGLAVGIIAAPCVGPFVVALLALVAQRGDALFGFQALFTLALGLGVPYLFLAMFSNLVQSLPRSGNWMVWVKKVFGVLLTAIGLYYVLIALAPDWAPWVLPVALVAGGAYLGFFDHHGSEKRGFRLFKWIGGLAAVVAGVFAVQTLRAEVMQFEPYSDHAMQVALASGRPVLVDFSADWCVPCHELEHSTFTDRRVIAEARRFAAFKVDLTRYNAPESQAMRERYGVTGVPEVLFFTPDGAELRDARVLGYVPAGPFLARMKAVGGS